MPNSQPINNNDEEQILQQVMKASMDTYAFEQTTYIDNAIYEDAPEQELDTILQQIKALHNIQTPIPIPKYITIKIPNPNNYYVLWNLE